MDIPSLIATVLGSSWAVGLNLYGSVAILGYLGYSDNLNLPSSLEVLSHPLVFGIAFALYAIEFFADKIPIVDSIWDFTHSFIKIPAGAITAAAVCYDISLPWAVAAGLIGGGVTTTTHIANASTRAMINTSPEPVSNVTASLTKDAIAVGGLWSAYNHPLIFFCIFALWILGMFLLFRKIRRFLPAWRLGNRPASAKTSTINK